ncbi:MAG: helix-hairpin-helix domain-containing protein [Planctomycetota bacterium]
MELWLRGCLLVGAVGLLAVMALSAELYLAHQRPRLDISPPRINPNTASVASLVRLPGIGKARAMDIIHYRQNHKHEGLAFASTRELQNIRGIGPKTAHKMSPWLTFEME